MASPIEVLPRGSTRIRLALLHSNGMCGAFYVPLAQGLAARGIASSLFDLPGYAGEPVPDPPGWAALLDTVERRLRPCLGDDGVLVGHSLGGLVALLLAPRLPLRAMVLLEPAIIPWRWLARVGAWIYVRRVFGAGPPTFRNRGPWFWRLHDPESFPADKMQLVLDTHARTDRALVAALHRELPERYPLPFAQLTAPTLVVRGASSGRVMAWGQRDLVGRLPSARAATVPAAGHWLANEQDAALVDIIAGFLDA